MRCSDEHPSSQDFPNLFHIVLDLVSGRLPASLADTGNLALVGQLTEADTANAVVPQVSVGSAADLAAVVAAGRELGLCLLLQDHRLLGHVVILLNQAVKGAPSWLSSSLASSSLVAVVQMQISIPRILSTLSYSISGKINCSLIPRA